MRAWISDRNVAAEIAVGVWAIAVATYSQYAALVNRYVVSGDAPQAISWLQRFRYPDAFNNDLLSDLAAQMHGQLGFVFFYRAFAPLVDPLWLSKFVPVVLLAVFAVYTFRLVNQFSTPFAAVLTAGLAIVTPTFLELMAGGHQRAFALPLMMAFLYYVTISAWRRACVALVILALFYPMGFLLGVPTYAMALVVGCRDRDWIATIRAPFAWLAVVTIACGTLLAVKNVYAPDPRIGRIVTRAEMTGRPEFYAIGRTAILPTPGLPEEMADQLVGTVRSLSLGYPAALLRLATGVSRWALIVPMVLVGLLVTLVVFRGVVRRSLAVPPVLVYFLIAGVMFHVLADRLLFRLYLPSRYLSYPVQLSGLVMAGLAVGYLVASISRTRVRYAVQIVLLVLIGWQVGLTRNIGLIDQSAARPLYEFLQTLPREALIASHPDAADYIPTFARRKVFVNFEQSYPFFDVYWRTMSSRTTSLFDAYYAETREQVYTFCEANGIDYLVVRLRDFDDAYLAHNRIYFQPFERDIRARLISHHRYALAQVADEDMLFRDGDTFVIGRQALKSGARTAGLLKENVCPTAQCS